MFSRKKKVKCRGDAEGIDEYHDGGVRPVRYVRRCVALNPLVCSEVVFVDLWKRFAREGLENHRGNLTVYQVQEDERHGGVSREEPP